MEKLIIIYGFIQICIFGLIDSIEDRLFPETEYQKPTFEIPISLKAPGEILSEKVKIKRAGFYHFYLKFRANESDDQDIARLRKLMGDYRLDKQGQPLDPGIHTPILMIVSKIDGDKKVEVYRYQADPLLTGGSGGNLLRQIGFSELLPGNYLYQLVLPRAVPEFNETPVLFLSAGGHFSPTYVPSKCNTLRSNYQSCQP